MEIMQMAALGVILVGVLIGFIGWVWLVVIGFKLGGALWGILNIFFQPITGIIFCVIHKTGWLPLALMIIGNVIALIGMIPIIMNSMNNMQPM